MAAPGFLVTAVLAAVGLFFVTRSMLSGGRRVNPLYFFGAALVGDRSLIRRRWWGTRWGIPSRTRRVRSLHVLVELLSTITLALAWLFVR